MIVTCVLLLLFVLLLAGTPVGFAMGFSGAIGLLWYGGPSVLAGVLQSTPLSTVNHYELITIPMFLLMAQFVLLSGLADELVDAAAAWFGRVRGGLGIAAAFAGAGFGAICGTSTAAAATLSSTSLPAMVRQGYQPEMAAGVIAVSGTLAMLIPPSVALIIYGLLAEENIGKLLIAGVIPGLLVTFTIAATVYVLTLLDPSRAPGCEVVPWRERIRLLKVVGPMLVLLFAVTGVIYTGIATPTEASSLGAAGALGLAIWRRRMNFTVLREALIQTATATCMLITIIIGAFIFGYFITLTYVTQDLLQWVTGLETSRWVIIAMILLIYLIMGAFMDQLAILVLSVPIVLPLVVSLGFDAIWFGVLMIVVAEIGMITPPVGMNCFVVSKYADRPVTEIFAGTLPFVVALLLVVVLLVVFPTIVLWLPSRM